MRIRLKWIWFQYQLHRFLHRKMHVKLASAYIFRISLIVTGIIAGFSMYHRTTNMWTLKNLGDSFLVKDIGRRPIVIGAFHRQKWEQNVAGDFAVIQFVGDSRQSHELYCHSEINGRTHISHAHIERIHKGKRAANDICSWGGHLAECQLVSDEVDSVRLSTSPEITVKNSIPVKIEEPLYFEERQKLVVCVAPMYIYTEWQIMVTGIETWLAQGATKLIFPIQSASNNTYLILKEYERKGFVILRDWPMWPVLSDTNPNGLVLSRGIEESHVNCLHFVKPFADMVVFTDIDDMLLPPDPMKVHPTSAVRLLQSLFVEHPQAGSFLFEHRDVQFVLPKEVDSLKNTLRSFNFNFLQKTHWKFNCRVWRMKTRVVVNASRVDSVNMHETGIHRFGYVQTRVPCRQAHFYHLRHSYKNIGNTDEWGIDMKNLAEILNSNWQTRLGSALAPIADQILTKSSVESFADFDRCMGSINSEHWTLHVSRCLTPHVCYSRLARNVGCVATKGDYEFAHNNGDYIIVLKKSHWVESEPNCEAPLPKYVKGDHYYLP